MLMQKPFTVTQGGADTAAETTISTNIQPGITFIGWEVMGVEFTLKPDVVKAWAAVDADLTLQLTKRSLSGSISRLVTYTDTDLVMSFNLGVISSGTPANIVIMETSFYHELPPGVLIYSEYVYAQLISTSTGQTNVAWGRLIYQPKNLSQGEALAVVASRP